MALGAVRAVTYRLTRRAQADLQRILDFLVPLNPVAARKLKAELLGAFQRAADAPRLGWERPALGARRRYIPAGSYLVFYRPMRYGAEISGIAHERQDLTKVFPKKKR